MWRRLAGLASAFCGIARWFCPRSPPWSRWKSSGVASLSTAHPRLTALCSLHFDCIATASPQRPPLNGDVVSDVVLPVVLSAEHATSRQQSRSSVRLPPTVAIRKSAGIPFRTDRRPKPTARPIWKTKFGGPQRAAGVRTGQRSRPQRQARARTSAASSAARTRCWRTPSSPCTKRRGGSHGRPMPSSSAVRAISVDGRSSAISRTASAIARMRVWMPRQSATRAVLLRTPALEQIAALDASVRRQGISGVPFLISA